MDSEAILWFAQYEITEIKDTGGTVHISARFTGPVACPDCSSEQLRSKGRYQRAVRHETWGMRHVFLILEAHKWLCRTCGRYFRQQFPGILKWQRATERFRRMVFSATGMGSADGGWANAKGLAPRRWSAGSNGCSSD